MADVTEKLKDLANLLREGLITREQFDQQRDALLDGGTPMGRPSSIGSYRITGEIGQGGMGQVYRGRHRTEAFAERQGGDVAIKVLHAQYASRPEIVERFEREATLGIQLNHPGIVKVHELVMDVGRVAMIMELVEGRPLSRMIGTETGPIPWERARPMVHELLRALKYAHDEGVIHRDLKPENIMVGPEGRLKVLDFGIAKNLGTGRTQTGTGMGTIDYMAPEQYLDAKSVDRRADIYALGMTFYEMLAGRLPWTETSSEFSVLEAKKNGTVPPPTNFYPDIPAAVEAVVMRMLAPNPDDRPATISDLMDAFAQNFPNPDPSTGIANAERKPVIGTEPERVPREANNQTSEEELSESEQPRIESVHFTVGRFFFGTIRVVGLGLLFLMLFLFFLNIVQETSNDHRLNDDNITPMMILFMVVLANGATLLVGSWFRDFSQLRNTARYRFHLYAFVLLVIVTTATIITVDYGVMSAVFGTFGAGLLAREKAKRAPEEPGVIKR